LENYVLFATIDEQWKEHLHALDGLKEGIGLRSYAQKDPLIEYKREAFDMFTDLLERINRLSLERLFRAQVAPAPPEIVRGRERGLQEIHKSTDGYGVGAAARAAGVAQKSTGVPPPRRQSPLSGAPPKSKTIVKGKKVGRNDPCPCGSGKKYKNCCGRK
ncbi:preprotein translocase subunit SecA, partial [bacterium]